MAEIQISLRAARVNSGMTIEQVAKDMHVSKQTVLNWEKGRVKPSFATLQTLSKMYGMPLDNIFLPEEAT